MKKGVMLRDYLISFENMNWETPASGIRFKAYVSGNQKVRLVEFTDELFEKDWCLKGHVGYVLEGNLSIDFSGKEVKFKRGDGLFIPEGTENKHKAKVAKGEKTLLIMFEKP